jgi:hypothetical protein
MNRIKPERDFHAIVLSCDYRNAVSKVESGHEMKSVRRKREREKEGGRKGAVWKVMVLTNKRSHSD